MTEPQGFHSTYTPASVSQAPTIEIFSEDHKLVDILRSTLGSDYKFVGLTERDLLQRLPIEHLIDAVVIDIAGEDAYRERAGKIFDELLDREVSVIIMADDDHRDLASSMVKRGAVSCVRKPPALRELKLALHKACESHVRSLRPSAEHREQAVLTGLDRLVGSGAQMQLVYKLVRKVANLEASILITGESGTGKELIARAIHNTGVRSGRPFVAVSCGAIPETLIESELFGHERGAFTGASGSRAGYLEEAADGTLFLDEIGEVNLQTQVKLLRVLQERAFNRLGSNHLTPLRARVILATHRDLEQMVADGHFRSDLFYRINVMNIKAPALRDHPEDIPLLVASFNRKYSEAYRKPIEAIEPETLALLQVYTWPGNVRELENAVQHSIVMAEGTTIRTSDLPDHLAEMECPAFDDGLPPGSFERLLREYKLKLATEAIENCHGNKTLAAQSLNISRAYLHRLIRMIPSAADDGCTEISIAHSDLGLAS